MLDATLRATRHALLFLALATAAALAQHPSAGAGASVFVIDSAEIAASNARTLSELLAARVPGLSVMRSGGSAAEGASVRMRGMHSLLLPSEPVIVVDGVRVSGRQAVSAIGSSVQPSEVDELLPEDIARIEVLRGPSAAASYGPGAADGVIVITTKSGAPGPLTGHARATAGLAFVPDRWPSNYHMNGVSPATGQSLPWCPVYAIAEGSCKPTTLDRFNPLEQASPFHAERTAGAHLSASGGRGGSAAYIGGIAEGTGGVLSGDDLHRLGARGHVAQRLPARLSIDASGALLRDVASIPNLAATVGAGLFGGAQNDTAHGYAHRNGPVVPPGDQHADRVTGSLGLRWQPVAWLDAAAVTGHDRVNEREGLSLPYLAFTQTGYDTVYGARRGRRHDDVRTLGASVAAHYRVRGTITMRTSLAWDRYTYSSYSRDSLGYGSSYTILTGNHGLRTSGLTVAQQLVWRDRLTLDGTVWRGGPASFGGTHRTELYPSASAAWSFGHVGPASGFRLRAAYGEAASLDPDFPVAAYVVDFGTATPASSHAERTRESEAGADVAFGSRVDASVTAFRAESRHLLILFSGQFGPAPQPVGAMRNTGVELLAHARLVDREAVRWTIAATLATLRNRVLAIGNAQRIAYVRGPFNESSTYAPGYPIASWWMWPYTYADANGDHMIDTSEVHFAKAPTFENAMSPAVESSVRSALELPRGLSLGLTLDYRGGYRLYDANEMGRCLFLGANCRGDQDPSAPLAEQAAAVAVQKNQMAAAFLENASFLRLRELSIGWTLPARLARVTGKATRISLVGLDLATFTRYKGVDPEISGASPLQLPRYDFEKLPILPTVLLRVEVGTR